MSKSDFILALFVGMEAPILGFFAWVVLKLGRHDTALAVLIEQVNPPGDKSLRTLLNDIQLEQARHTPSQN